MSLVRPADPSATTYGESKLYVGKGSSNNSNLSNQVSRPEKRMFNYGPASYCSDINDQQCFSSAATGPIQQVAYLRPSQSGISGSLFQSQVSSAPYQLMGDSGSSISAQNPYSSCFSSTSQPPSSFTSISHQISSSISESQSPDIGYDGDEIRSKLQELERELLDDSDDLLDDGDDMGIDYEWVEPMKNLLIPSSPKESSSDSNLSTADSSKETRTLKQLLFDCANAISEGHFEKASAIIADLRQTVSIQGDPPQRLAAYMVEGLAARMASSGQGIYKALKCKEPPTSDRLSAMQILFEVCPCFKFGFMAANGAIAEASKDEEKVHIIDFDINQGSQYITLMQALSTRKSKPRLRITGVDDPESVQRAVGGLRVIGQRLEKLAEELHIPFEFRAIAAKTGDVTPAILGCRPGEALVVNFAYQLHHMPDESVSTVNQRDQLLRMVKGLGPKLVTVVEQDVNTNTAPFFPRFVEVYNYYHAVFESLDATLPRDSPDRMNVEKQCLARDIVNIVACEGADRIERYEAAGKWRARMTMAGFVSCPLSSYVNGAIRAQLKLYCDRYKVKEEAGALYFGWEDKILVVASAWR